MLGVHSAQAAWHNLLSVLLVLKHIFSNAHTRFAKESVSGRLAT